jgi:hypothetical protein
MDIRLPDPHRQSILKSAGSVREIEVWPDAGLGERPFPNLIRELAHNMTPLCLSSLNLLLRHKDTTQRQSRFSESSSSGFAFALPNRLPVRQASMDSHGPASIRF